MTLPKLEKILLVEDEQDIQMVASMALEELGGYRVEVCSSGSEAVAKAPGFGPELILLDVMMPELDGPGTFRALRDLEGFVMPPVIYMTARAQLSEIEEYRRSGAIDVIVKPFDPMTLATKVQDIWDQHHGQG